MENKYLLLYKNHTVRISSEKKIYEILEEDEDKIWNILVPIQSDSVEYIMVKPKRFIPRFKCITFNYYLTVHLYGDVLLVFDLDGNEHVYKRANEEMKIEIRCYTPMEFYSTLYSIDRIRAINTILSFDGNMYDCFEITFDDMIIDFKMNDGEYIYKSSNMTEESEYADFEGEVSKLFNSINKFIGTNILRSKKKAINLNSKDYTAFVNNDSTWGKAKNGNKEYTDIESPFKITQIKDINPKKYHMSYLQSIATNNRGFRSTIFAFPEDISLMSKYIDEIELTAIFFSYNTPIEDWPLDINLCAKTIYDYDELTEIYADYNSKINSTSDTIAIICNLISIYRSLNIIRNTIYGSIEGIEVIVELEFHPEGHHSDGFAYTISSRNMDDIKDPYKDIFKKLRKFLGEKGYLR